MSKTQLNNNSLLVNYVIISLLLPLSLGYIDNFGNVFSNMGDQLAGYIDNLYTSINGWSEHVIRHAKTEECELICPNGNWTTQNKFISWLFTWLTIH